MKLTIKNRKGEKVVVLVEKAKNPKGLVFIMHGLGGFKEQAHIQTFAEAFKDNDYTVVRFDTTNTFGESDGDYANATVTNYFEDLEDVIVWTKSQDFCQEPFCLAGHSIGGMCISLYAQKYSMKVKALAPISTIISGKLWVRFKEQDLKKWEKNGFVEYKSTPTSTRIKRLKWSHYEDRMKYDLLKDVDKLKMPILMICGDEDPTAYPKHQKLLFDKLPGKKEFHIIKGAPHTFIDKNHLNEIKKIFDKWIKTL